MILYVSHNEETSCIKIVHFCDDVKGVPSEMEANAKSMSGCPAIFFPVN